MAFSQNIETDIDEMEEILRKIQNFDPAGIAARTLQECLIIQLERKEHPDDPTVMNALLILQDCFEEFTKKHYSKIQKRLDLDEEQIKDSINLITRLNLSREHIRWPGTYTIYHSGFHSYQCRGKARSQP